MKFKKFFILIVFVFLIFFLFSCSEGVSPFSVISVEKIGENEEGYIYEIIFIDNNSYELIVPFGIDGDTPYVGTNGNWWIGNTDLGLKVSGEVGKPGKDGKDGIDGIDGINGTDGKDGADGINGIDGKDGVNGTDGSTPYIGSNGNWWIGEEDLGYKAIGIDGLDGTDGIDGSDGVTPYVGTNGNWWIGEVDLGYKAIGIDGLDGTDGIDGIDGDTPYVGTNGNWWIGEVDLGYKAIGLDGLDGADGIDGSDGNTPYVGSNGNWWIGEIDTGSYAGYNPDKIFETGNFVFARNSDGLSYYLANYNGYDRVINIPNEFNGYPVTTIGPNAFIDNDIAETIIISKTITILEKKSFYNMANLHTVIFEDESELEMIEESVFENSISLKNMFLPENLIIIKKNAFKNTSLVNLIVPMSVELIDENAFSSISTLEIVSFNPHSIVDIKSKAFENAISLQTLNLPDSLKIINSSVFKGAINLKHINLPADLEIINNSAFEGSGIISLTIPKSVTDIKSNAFYNSFNLINVEFENESNLNKIYSGAFSNASEIKTLTIPRNVVSIGDEAFMNLTELETLIFEDGSELISVGKYAFYGMQNLTELNLPENIEIIADYSFGNPYAVSMRNEKIKSIIIPDSVQEIGEGAFQGYINLEYISVPFVGRTRSTGSLNDSEFASPYLFGYIFGSSTLRNYNYNSENQIYQGQTYYYHTNGLLLYRRYYIPDTLQTIVITDANKGIFSGAFYGIKDRNINNITFQ